jgi:hypothetical protein
MFLCIAASSYTAKSSLAEAQASIAVERNTDKLLLDVGEDGRKRSASNQSTTSQYGSSVQLVTAITAAGYFDPQLAILLDSLKLTYVRQLRSCGAHEVADTILLCLSYPLRCYSDRTSVIRDPKEL